MILDMLARLALGQQGVVLVAFYTFQKHEQSIINDLLMFQLQFYGTIESSIVHICSLEVRVSCRSQQPMDFAAFISIIFVLI